MELRPLLPCGATGGSTKVPLPVEDQVKLASNATGALLMVERTAHSELEASEDGGRQPGGSVPEPEIQLLLVRHRHPRLRIDGAHPGREVQGPDEPQHPERRKVVDSSNQPRLLVSAGKILGGWRVDQGQE